uniref:Uncharacterized protein n=1 Tax=Lepeophtheirus salmonis TaxID=72036 RepID=A0A0K2VE79_LEPSM
MCFLSLKKSMLKKGVSFKWSIPFYKKFCFQKKKKSSFCQIDHLHIFKNRLSKKAQPTFSSPLKSCWRRLYEKLIMFLQKVLNSNLSKQSISL